MMSTPMQSKGPPTGMSVSGAQIAQSAWTSLSPFRDISLHRHTLVVVAQLTEDLLRSDGCQTHLLEQ
jgi:hypothetical protein